jgi:hypothetical protein
MQGATACLCRDVPFSMIYFTSYAHLKVCSADLPSCPSRGLRQEGRHKGVS